MEPDRILIVDDEENIRFTLSQALVALPAMVDAASSGEEALAKVEQNSYALVLLDLRLPGMNGMEVLQTLRDTRPEIPVLVITAHGAIDTAVEAMKLGAIDYLQKPFTPEEIREQARRILRRRKLHEDETNDYALCFELAKRCLSQRYAEAAINHLRRAIAAAPERPEAFNLLGAIHELRGEMHEALNNYRAAWSFDPSYEPARKNIERATGDRPRFGAIILGELRSNAPEHAARWRRQ